MPVPTYDSLPVSLLFDDRLLSLGPTFKILVQATASLDVGLDMQVDLSYAVKNAKLFFPPTDGSSSGGSFVPGQERTYLVSPRSKAPYPDPSTLPQLPFQSSTALKLSISPSITSNAKVAAHIIPRLEIGIDGLDGIANVNVFLDLDASASLSLSALETFEVTPATLPLGHNATSSTTVAARGAPSSQVRGCVDAGLEIAANAGADASFFGLFNPSTSVSLFDKKFPIFEECFSFFFVLYGLYLLGFFFTFRNASNRRLEGKQQALRLPVVDMLGEEGLRPGHFTAVILRARLYHPWVI